MKMVEEELQAILEKSPAGDEVFVPRAFLALVIKEIEHLRSIVGAVTSGESFDDIAARVGRHPKEERT